MPRSPIGCHWQDLERRLRKMEEDKKNEPPNIYDANGTLSGDVAVTRKPSLNEKNEVIADVGKALKRLGDINYEVIKTDTGYTFRPKHETPAVIADGSELKCRRIIPLSERLALAAFTSIGCGAAISVTLDSGHMLAAAILLPMSVLVWILSNREKIDSWDT